MTRCSICNLDREKRAAIDDALRGNVPLGRIAEASGSSKSALSRHSQHLGRCGAVRVPDAAEKRLEQPVAPAQAAAVAQVDPAVPEPTKEQLLSRVERLWLESIDGLEAAKQPIRITKPDGATLELPGDLRARSAFLREARQVLEFQGEATGLVKRGPLLAQQINFGDSGQGLVDSLIREGQRLLNGK